MIGLSYGSENRPHSRVPLIVPRRETHGLCDSRPSDECGSINDSSMLRTGIELLSSTTGLRVIQGSCSFPRQVIRRPTKPLDRHLKSIVAVKPGEFLGLHMLVIQQFFQALADVIRCQSYDDEAARVERETELSEWQEFR